jgi:hypothetical protein
MLYWLSVARNQQENKLSWSEIMEMQDYKELNIHTVTAQGFWLLPLKRNKAHIIHKIFCFYFKNVSSARIFFSSTILRELLITKREHDK